MPIYGSKKVKGAHTGSSQQDYTETEMQKWWASVKDTQWNPHINMDNHIQYKSWRNAVSSEFMKKSEIY